MTPEAEEERIYKVSEIKRICAERDALVAALELLVPGYEQYIDWAVERGVLFTHHGRDNLAIARAALAKARGE